jgi:hypothetical protein
MTDLHPSLASLEDPSQNALFKQGQTKINENWVKQFDDPKVLAFYAYPLLTKWFKARNAPQILLVSPVAMDPQDIFAKKSGAHFTSILSEALDQQTDRFDLIWVMQPEVMELEVTLNRLSPIVCPGGAVILVMPNVYDQLDMLTPLLDRTGYTQPYMVGFHPKGTIAWWPSSHKLTLWLGNVLNEIACFLPFKYETGLRFGQCSMLRVLKQF